MDWRACLPSRMTVGEGQVAVFFLRFRRAGRLSGAPASWATLKEERLEEEPEGRVDAGARPSRLEEETEGTCEDGAVELRLVEGLVEVRCEVVGREEDCGVVEL